MALKQAINDAVKAALKAGEKEKLTTLRMVLAAIKQIEVDERVELNDNEIIAILAKMVKERRDAIEKFQDGGREDLANKEKDEINFISVFLPEPLSEAEIKQMITDAITTSNAESMKDMGKVIAIIRPQMEGRANMAEVSKLVKDLLQ